MYHFYALSENPNTVEQSAQSTLDSSQINGVDQGSCARDNLISTQNEMNLDTSQLSLAEIASCSYEAR